MSNRAPLNNMFREGSLGKTTAQEHAVAVTTQEALDSLDWSREKTMRIANVENNTLKWVLISSAGALDITHCDISVRSARDETRHIIGSSEPDIIIKSDKNQNRECRRKDKDHIKFLCEAQVARGRCSVHELTSGVNWRMKCVAKTMAMPGTRTAVADLCMFGLAACEGGPGFVNACVRTITNTSWSAVATQMQEHPSTRLRSTGTTQSRMENKQDRGCAKSLEQRRSS